MAKLLTGTRIYGTGTVDTQLFVSGTNSATSTTTGALQVVGGVGIGGNLYVGGTIFGGTLSGTASTATNADNIKTVLQTSSASHYLAFVDSNNSTAAYEALYTTSSFIINPQSGTVGIGTSTITSTLEVFSSSPGVKINDGISNVHVQVNGSNPRVVFIDGRSGGRRFDIGSSFSTATFSIIDRTAGIERLLIDANGNIGIGTTNPASKFVVYGGTVNSTTYTSSEARIADGTLHLMKTSAGGVFEALRAINNDTTVGTTVRLLAAATSDPFNNANGGKVFIDAVRTASNMDLIFSLNDASGAAAVERLRILGSGAIAFNGSTSYGVSGQILQSNGNAAPTWISTGSLAAANATTATHLSGGVAGQIPYQTAPGVTSFLSTGTAGNVLVSNGSSAPTYNNTLTLTGTTAAVSTTTGALQVVGGVGVGGDLYIRGDILTNDTTFNLINANATTVNFAGAATALTMGASGSGTTNVRNNLTVSGNLTVQGTTTIVDSTLTNIADPILTLGGGTGNTAPIADDNKDRGVAFKWVNDGGTTSTGFFGYDDSTGYFTYVQTATITNEVVSGTKGAMDVNLAGGSAMAIVYQSSPNATGFLAAGSSGFILQTNGTGSPPTWVSASGVSAGSATNADNIRTILQAGNAVYYPTFVDSNNASNAYESVYTTGTFVINPATGYIGMGTASPSRPLHVFTLGTATQGIAAFEAKASGFVIQDNGSQNGNVELVGYKQTSSTYHNILIRGSGDGLLVQTGTGNVGIGDTAPGTKLTVLGAGGSTLGTNGYLVHVGGTDSSVDPVRYMIGFSHGNNSTSTNVRAAIGGMVTTGGAGNLIFETGSSGNQVERMRITGSGGVSFGTGGANYGSSGQILQSNGNAAPTWVTAISGSSAQVNTVLQASNASYYPAFVDSNNASATAESLYTTSSFSINPFSGLVTISGNSGDGVPILRVTGRSAPAAGFNWAGSFMNSSLTTGKNTVILIGQAESTKNSGYIGFNYAGTSGSNNSFMTIGLYANDNILNVTGAGLVGVGTTSPVATMDVRGGLAVSGWSNNNGGSAGGLEIGWDGTQGLIQSYNRTGSAYTDITLNGLINKFLTSGTERLRITSSGGIAFGGASNYGSAGQMLQSNGDASPTWVALSSRTVGTSTQVTTVAQTANATYYPTFVDSNNASATAESIYTTSSFSINPGTGLLTVTKTAQIGTSVAQGDPSATDITANATLLLSGVGGNYLSFGQKASNLAQWIQSGYSNPTTAVYPISLNPLGGNVGIGTLTPSVKFHVSGSSIIANNTSINPDSYTNQTVAGGVSDGSWGVTSAVGGNAGTGKSWAIGHNGTYLYFGAGNNTANSSLASYMVAGGTTRNLWLVPTSGGNVSIGFAEGGGASHRLDINSLTTYSYAQGSYSSGATIGLRAASTTANDYTGIRFTNNNGSREAFFGVVQGTASNIGDFVFQTYSATTTSYGERMRVMHNGNVGIGTTNPANKFEVAGTAGQLFSISDSFTGTIFSANDVSGIPSIEVLDTGLVKLAQYNGAVAIGTGTVSSSTAELSVYGMLYTSGPQGEIRASNEITAYFSSDARLKENIKLIENPITILDQIRGVTFDWTDEHMASRGGEDGYFVRKHDIGVIAQEVQAVLPELVGTREDGYLAVKYEKMVALLIEAIKEQQKSIDMLKIELEKIKKQ